LRSLTNIHRYDPTIEDSYSVTRTIDGTTYSLRLTDTAGQEEYRGLWSQANLKCDAFLLVYDITQSSSLEALEYFTQMIDIEREDRMEQNQILPVCIVAGNKCDLQNMRQIGARDGLEWSRQHNFGFMETSAREMVNIEETFAREFALAMLACMYVWQHCTDHFAVIVRRVVEARKNAAAGIPQENPLTATRSSPPNTTNQPEHDARSPAADAREKELPPPPKKAWYSSLKCW
jgi:GTPase KRas protein